MEFKKINDRRFQCRLDEEDLEDNNISLDDFFKNDTDKIHSLLEVIMEEAEKNIGITLSGEVMSLQLAPQPDHSILLTVSSYLYTKSSNCIVCTCIFSTFLSIACSLL